jgi:tRNA/tmRNA/rRNA uracil-C5-methylase (TrmA/RlmC/RlmD family)
MSESLVGQIFEVEVGPVAHGGHCVARIGGDHGRVVFVRHTYPGELVRALVTEDGGKSFCRADAITVVRPAPERVEPACPYAGPGRCGGCDWQHVEPAAQRSLKKAVVIEQLHRLSGLAGEAIVDDLEVQELPGGPLGWRLRTRYAVAPGGRVGLHRHRSNQVEIIDHCPISAPDVGDAPELAEKWGGASGLEITTNGVERSVLVHRPIPVTHAVRAARAKAPRRRQERAQERVQLVSGPSSLTRRVNGHDFSVAAQGFWQGHAAAAAAYTEAVIGLLAPQPGETVADLYAGAGLFSVPLAAAVGTTGRVVAIEGDRQATEDAAQNLADYPWAEIRRSPVTAAVVAEIGTTDLIVLDPPRTGAGREVMTAILASGARAVAYVACDPAAFARDVRTALDQGWALEVLRAFDAYPMTHHVECIGVLVPRVPQVS